MHSIYHFLQRATKWRFLKMNLIVHVNPNCLLLHYKLNCIFVLNVCVCVCREPQGVFLSFCLLHLWTCSFQLRGEKKKLTREQVVSVQGLSNSFFVLLSHKGSSDKGCRSERNLEEHAREVRHLEKGFSCHFHIWGAVRYFNFLTLSCLEDSLAE